MVLQVSSASASYLHQFIGPSLRVILSVMSTLSQSDSVLKQVSHQFLEAHPQLVDRILKGAGGTGSALGWARGTVGIGLDLIELDVVDGELGS